jgi:pyruvate dehydrogenase E2 component (dihydrolipoamide acetyltransferase)
MAPPAIPLIDIVLPNVGFDMQEGRLLGWLKQVGDPVRKGEAIAEIEGDKATIELEATADGILAEILAPADATMAVGGVIARIRPAGAAPSAPYDVPPDRRPQRASPLAAALARDLGVDLASVTGSGSRGRITRSDVQAHLAGHTAAPTKPQAAPAVRHLARNHNINLREVPATGPHGRVTRRDVESRIRAASVPQTASTRRAVTLSPMRRAIARRMTESIQTAPHFFTSAELDFTDALVALPAGIGPNSLLLYLTVKALQQVPALNATYEDDQLYRSDTIDLAVAVALDDGLITPVLTDAAAYSLEGLNARARDLIQQARAGKLRAEALSGGTFTLSNLGVVQQVDQFTAILNPPQVGILAVGALKPRLRVLNGGVHIRTTAHLTLSADHRAVDGMIVARFLEAFDRALQTFGHGGRITTEGNLR